MPAADPLVVALTGLLLKATAIVSLAFVTHAALGRWVSASGRHLVMTLATVMLLALPFVSRVVPAWPVPILQVAAAPAPVASGVTGVSSGAVFNEATATDASGVVASPTASQPVPANRPVTRVPWNVVALAVYVFGVVAMLGHLALQRWRVHALGRAARAVTDPAWQALLAEGTRALGVRRTVRLLRSRTGTMPMTFGTRRPAILLPATADTWDDDRRRAVVLHELAHVARLDCLTQWGACLMRAVYWCHPGAWWMVSRVRLDREFACDDLVLAAGAPPQEYARHLLDIAYTFGGGRAPALAVRMARRSQLEGRLTALLDRSRVRHRPSRPARMATTAGAFAVLLPLASATAPTPLATPDVASGHATATAGAPVARANAQARVSAEPHVAALPRTTDLAPLTVLLPAGAAVTRGQAAATAGTSDGCTWEVGPGNADTVHFSIRQGRSQSGRNVMLSQLEGLTAAQLGATGPVRFVVTRDAGTFSFEGTARGGVAAGVCSFAPSPTFGAELAKRGVTGLTPEDQLQMARHDVSLAFVDELRTQKYATPSVADLVKAGQHGVHLTYLKGMAELGYATGTLAPLITLRDHGVTPEYARALASLGYSKLPIDQLQRARDHGVTPAYVQGMRDAGHGTLTLDQLVTTRDHGVTPEFGKAMAAAGYTGVALDQLVRVRDHGVTPDYIRDMKALGIGGPLEDLVRARDHGVTPDYVRGLEGLGYAKLALDQLIRMRDHGVTPSFVKEIQALGYKGLTPDELVTLRDHGLTASRISRINAKAGSPLSVSDLRHAAARGMH
jgi:beta-lactamase regulating signal transducer with metallopeptidase domain